jgi:hypothetical protein
MVMANQRVRYLIKNEKNKWFAGDSANKAFNTTGIKFVVDKVRAHNFGYQINVDYWACKLERDYGVKVTIVKETI